MNRTSRFGWPRKRKVSDASELAESMVFRRKFLVKEHSEACPRVSPSSAVLNSDNDGIGFDSTSRENEIGEGEFRHCQGTRQHPDNNPENFIQLHSHVFMMNNVGMERFRLDVQYEQQKSNEDAGDRCALQEMTITYLSSEKRF